MKRLLSLVVALLLLTVPAVCASAPGIDLSGMSFDELVSLRSLVDAALWQSDGWQEVTVPVGTYQIGVDIPSGRWTITPADGQVVSIGVGTDLKDNGNDLAYTNYSSYYLMSPTSWGFQKGEPESITLSLKSGYYIQIENGSVVFTPDVGPSFTFK